MFKRRGECFGEEKICNDFKPIPKVTDEEKANWPVVMRSSSQSVHMEWKREQAKIEGRSRYKASANSKVKREANKEVYSKDNKEVDKKEIKEPTKKIPAETSNSASKNDDYIIKAPELFYDNITSLRKKYSECIIIWIGDVETSGNKSYCRYLLEYKNQYLAGQGQSSINMFDAVYNCVAESVSKIHDYPKFDIVIVYPMIVYTINIENRGMYDRMIKLLETKSERLNLFALPDRQVELSKYLRCNNNEHQTYTKYAEVVNKAKKALGNPNHYPLGKIQFDDCPVWQKGDQINLWTYWQGYQIKDLENGVDILLVGQDWGNPDRDIVTIDRIKKIQEGEEVSYHFSSSPTDKRLWELFFCLGCDIGSKKPGKRLLFTNYCLGYRAGNETGGMTRDILSADKELFDDLVDAVMPKIIICLGKLVYEQVSGTVIDNFTELLKSNGPIKSYYPKDKRIKVYGVPHCGVWGLRNIGGEEAMKDLWSQIAEENGFKPIPYKEQN